jgi:hypothetical protein
MAIRKGVLFEVQRSLTRIRAARIQFVPLSMDHSNPSAMTFQIGLRDVFLSEIRTISANLRRMKRMYPESSPYPAAGRERRKRRSRAAARHSGRTARRARI